MLSGIKFSQHFLAFLGFATTIIPRYITYYISTGLFALFGIKMLKEGLGMSADEGKEELEEVQAELKKKEEEVSNYRRIKQDFNK